LDFDKSTPLGLKLSGNSMTGFDTPTIWRNTMAIQKPGSSTGNSGGIFQQVGPHGGKQPNFATVADWKPLPPTTKPGHGWISVKTTPSSKR
jgi:hypothetical protein